MLAARYAPCAAASLECVLPLGVVRVHGAKSVENVNGRRGGHVFKERILVSEEAEQLAAQNHVQI